MLSTHILRKRIEDQRQAALRRSQNQKAAAAAFKEKEKEAKIAAEKAARKAANAAKNRENWLKSQAALRERLEEVEQERDETRIALMFLRGQQRKADDVFNRFEKFELEANTALYRGHFGQAESFCLKAEQALGETLSLMEGIAIGCRALVLEQRVNELEAQAKKLKMALCGRLPTLKELKAVEASGAQTAGNLVIIPDQDGIEIVSFREFKNSDPELFEEMMEVVG